MVPKQNMNETQYFYWSTYRVDREFVKLTNVVINSKMINSKKLDGKYFKSKFSKSIVEDLILNSNKINETSSKDLDKWTELGIVAVLQEQQLAFSQIDLIDIETSKNTGDILILNLKLNKFIEHTFPEINRCCKLNGRKIKYDGIDNVKRINCHMPKKEFIEEYVNKREVVIMKGCQNEWPAKDWTFDNLLDRYGDTASLWVTEWHHSENKTRDSGRIGSNHNYS